MYMAFNNYCQFIFDCMSSHKNISCYITFMYMYICLSIQIQDGEQSCPCIVISKTRSVSKVICFWQSLEDSWDISYKTKKNHNLKKKGVQVTQDSN